MSEPLPPEFQVVEGSQEEVRCILPSRPPQLGRYLIGFALLAFLLTGGFLLVPTLLFHREGFFLLPFIVLVPFCLALAAAGLYLAAGHVEVEIRRGMFRSVARLGPLKWSRSWPVDRVRRFLVSEVPGKAGRVAAPAYKLPADMAMLTADVGAGKPVAVALLYPRDLLQRLADELSRRREMLPAEPPAIGGREESPERQAVQAAASELGTAAEAAPAREHPDDLPTVPAVASSGKPGTALRYWLASGDDHPGCMLGCVFFFMLGWWGFLSFWGYELAQSHRQDPAAWANAPGWVKGWLWVQTIFFVPFGLAGLWLVGYFLWYVYRTLGHRRSRVEVSAQPLHPGQEFEVFVSQSGPLRLKSLRVLFVCQEEASYGQGTDIRTETRRTEQIEVVYEEAFAIARGFPYEFRRTLRVPARAMHSFQARHHKVRWLVVIAGDVAGWPNFERTFPVVVHPAPGDEEPR
jgi:hypothetical protein